MGGRVIGGIALVLTISGIYGVLAYAVARRTKEIGIRMALGESAAGVVGMILKQSMRLCAIGLGIGLTLAVALATALVSSLVMMDTFDVAAFSAGIVIVIAAGADTSRTLLYRADSTRGSPGNIDTPWETEDERAQIDIATSSRRDRDRAAVLSTVEFIVETHAGRTSGRRLPLPTRARPTRARVPFASRACTW